MTDFPATVYMPSDACVNTFSAQCLIGGATSAAAVWPLANRAIYIPFVVETAVVAYQMTVSVATQSGNLDVGIYDEYGVRLVSKGSTAVAVAGMQRIDITDTPLPPAQYYMAMSCDNITASFTRGTPTDALALDVLGLRTQDLASVTLPAPATFASPTTTYVPLVSISFNAIV